jgi:hypothetical protein
MIKAAVAKMLTVKLGIAAGTAVAATGVAVAAGTGNLHNPFQGTPAASHSPSAGNNGPQGSPSPSLLGLCHAVSSGNKAEHGKALENPAFTALINAAGGKDKVEGFCADLLKSKAPSKPAEAGQGHPTGKPSVPAPSHPTGQPSRPGK